MKKKLFLFVSFFIISPQCYASFTDVDKTHPYYEAIEYSQNQHIINGYPDSTFRPDNTINRAEFTKIIIEAIMPEEFKQQKKTLKKMEKFNEPINLNCFKDINSEAWYSVYICFAKNYNIINGYEDGTFKPNQDISFAEAAKIILNSLNAKITTETEDTWFQPYVKKMEEKNAIPSSIKNNFQKITRGEMIQMIWILETQSQMYYFEKNTPNYSIKGPGVWYSLDENNKVHFREGNTISPIPEADYQTFEQITDDNMLSDEYAKDKNHVYKYGAVIKEADPDTFEILEWPYTKDKNFIYYNYSDDKNYIILDIDYTSFEIINSYYFKDKNHVFYQNSVIENADPKTFTEIPVAYSQSYGKDKNSIFFNGKMIPHADLNTFRVTNEHGDFAEDKNQRYQVTENCIQKCSLEECDSFSWITVCENKIESLPKSIE